MNIEKNESENTQSNDLENKMIINENIINGIKEIGRHAKFLSILAYVSIIFMIFCGIAMFISGTDERIVVGVIYLVSAGVTYLITNKLWKASKSYRNISENTIDNLELGVKNMTSFWKISSTICKLYFAILALIFVLAFFAYIFS